MTTKNVMLVNLEPILGFILKIKNIPNYLHMHMVLAMCFYKKHILKKVGKNEVVLEVYILT